MKTLLLILLKILEVFGVIFGIWIIIKGIILLDNWFDNHEKVGFIIVIIILSLMGIFLLIGIILFIPDWIKANKKLIDKILKK